jgi:hypothetical protein
MVAMARTRRFAAAGIALAVGALAFAATSAAAAPYSTQATLSVSSQTVVEGGTFVLTGAGFCASESVGVNLHTTTYPLTSAHTDSAGSFSVTETLPQGVLGVHTVTATGVTCGRSASVTITIVAASTGGGGGGGGLASTGVAVIGIGALGLILLVGGGLMLLAGKRRKVSA